MLLAHTFVYKPRPLEGTGRAFIVGVAAGREFVEVEPLKGIVGKQADRLRGVAFAPAVFLADENPDLAQPVDPVDRSELNVADVAITLVQDDGEENVVAVPLLARNV